MAKLPVRTKTQELLPSAAVRGAYDLKLTPEAMAKLAEIKEYGDYAAEQAEAASRVSVTDDASNARAGELMVNLTKARKGLEDLQKFFTQPLESRKKIVIATFKKLLEHPLGQEDRLRREIGEYFVAETNRKAKEEAEKKAKLEADQRRAAQLGRSAPKVVAAPEVAAPVKTVHSENGSSSVSLVWALHEVKDLAQVPDKYTTRVLNKAAVDAAIEAGVHEIPGLDIRQKPRVAAR